MWQASLCGRLFLCLNGQTLSRRLAYFLAGAAGAVGAVPAAGAGVTAALAAAPAFESASVVAFLASAAFLAMPAVRRQYDLSTLPDFASTFVGTIQEQAVASVLQVASSLPLQTTTAALAAAGAAAFGATGVAGAFVAAAGAAGAAAFGAVTAGAAGAVGAVVCAVAATVKIASAPAAADTPIVQVDFFITAVISSG